MGILAHPVGRLEELVPEILESVAALQTLLAREVADLQNQDASAAGSPQVGVGVSRIDVVDAVESQQEVEVWQEAPAEEVQVVVDVVASVAVAGAGAVVRLPHGHPFGAVGAHAESHPFDLDRELPYPLAYPAVAGLVGLPEIHQVLMVAEVRRVRSEAAKHLQLGQWVRKVEREVVGV